MNKKRIFSIIIIMVMVCAMAAAGCGKKEETTKNKDEPKQEETKKEEADKAEPEKDAEAVDDEKQEEVKDDSSKPADLSEASAEMGVSEEKVQELHNIVKGILEEKYFPKYNISPEEFEWPSAKASEEESSSWIYLQVKVQKKTRRKTWWKYYG